MPANSRLPGSGLSEVATKPAAFSSSRTAACTMASHDHAWQSSEAGECIQLYIKSVMVDREKTWLGSYASLHNKSPVWHQAAVQSN